MGACGARAGIRVSQSCAKCGGSDVATFYHARGCDREHCSCKNCGYSDHAKSHDEHLHFYCRTCQFDWIGATVDA